MLNNDTTSCFRGKFVCSLMHIFATRCNLAFNILTDLCIHCRKEQVRRVIAVRNTQNDWNYSILYLNTTVVTNGVVQIALRNALRTRLQVITFPYSWLQILQIAWIGEVVGVVGRGGGGGRRWLEEVVVVGGGERRWW